MLCRVNSDHTIARVSPRGIEVIGPGFCGTHAAEWRPFGGDHPHFRLQRGLAVNFMTHLSTAGQIHARPRT